MGFPADHIEGLYRNAMDDVVRYVSQFFMVWYMIYICSHIIDMWLETTYWYIISIFGNIFFRNFSSLQHDAFIT